MKPGSLGYLCAGLLALSLHCSSDEPTQPGPAAGAAPGASGQPAAVSGSGGSAATSGAVAGSGTTSQPVGSAGRAAPSGNAGRAAPSGTAGRAAPSGMAGAGQPPAAGAAPPAAGSGSAPPSGPATPSTGCGVMDFPPSGNMTMDVDGTAREYIVKIPTDYDPKKPYRLIFAWHGLGGTAMSIAGGFGGGYYGLAQRSANSAIFIAGQGLPTSGSNGMEGGAGWPNTNGRDVAFVRKLFDWATSKYCVDKARVFSVGMSYGGIMSNTLGCEMGDVFRAIAPMSGSGPRTFGGRMCVSHVAAWLSHGNMDTVVQFSAGQGSRDHWVMANHCTMETMPVGPDACVAYQGCDAGYPVHWCEFSGGHTVPPFASDAIWKFFSQF